MPAFSDAYKDYVTLTLTKRTETETVTLNYKNGKFYDADIFANGEARLYTLTVTATDIEEAYDIATSLAFIGSETNGDFTVTPSQILTDCVTNITYTIDGGIDRIQIVAKQTQGENQIDITDRLTITMSADGKSIASVQTLNTTDNSLDTYVDPTVTIYVTVKIPKTREEGDVVSVDGDMIITDEDSAWNKVEIKDIEATGTVTVNVDNFSGTDIKNVTADAVVINSNSDVSLDTVTASSVNITTSSFGANISLNACDIDNLESSSQSGGQIDIVADGGSITNTTIQARYGTPINITAATIDNLSLKGGENVTITATESLKNTTINTSVGILDYFVGGTVQINAENAIVENLNITGKNGIVVNRGEIKSAYINGTNNSSSAVTATSVDFIEIKGSGHATVDVTGDILHICTDKTFYQTNERPTNPTTYTASKEQAFTINANSVKSSDLYTNYVTINLTELYDEDKTDEALGNNKFTLLSNNNSANPSNAQCAFTSDENSLNEIRIKLTANRQNSAIKITDK